MYYFNNGERRGTFHLLIRQTVSALSFSVLLHPPPSHHNLHPSPSTRLTLIPLPLSFFPQPLPLVTLAPSNPCPYPLNHSHFRVTPPPLSPPSHNSRPIKDLILYIQPAAAVMYLVGSLERQRKQYTRMTLDQRYCVLENNR